MQIFFGADHGGFELKEFLKEKLKGKNEVKDFGCENEQSCDYPDYAEKVGKAVAESNGSAIGILLCGTGIGMAMAANKVRGIRAAVVWDEFSAKMAKEHNNANVICMGGRALEKEKALQLANLFLKCKFLGETKEGKRHRIRVEKINALDERRQFPEPVVGALIMNDRNEVFLMKSPKWGDLYSIPGGHIEAGETRIDALRREIKEETNMDIHDEKLFVVHDAIFPKEFHRKKHFIMIDYLVKPKGEKFRLSKSEGTKGVWMQPELALKELKINEFTKESLEQYVKIMGLAKVF